MLIYEPRADWQAITPKGNAIVLFVTDYGYEGSTTLTCVINETGSMFTFQMHEVKFRHNYTFGRGKWNELNAK